ncbi:MAG: 3-phosphoshikimate 1-carboxyvinyltransferase [Actinomycetota bacterium]
MATVRLPGSKSLTNRELVLSALAASPSVLINPLVSRDSELMIQALRNLGVEIRQQTDSVKIFPKELVGETKIDCGLAGTVMRFIPPLAALAKGSVEFDGDPQARQRPMGTTIDSLRKLGIEVKSQNQSLPFTLIGSGQVTGGKLEIDASKSSQFVSGLLLAAPRFEQGLTLSHVGEHVPSLPHIDMTLKCLQERNISAHATSETSWEVKPGEIAGAEVEIEPDLSNAGPFLAAALVTGSEVRVEGWPTSTTQVGDEFRNLLSQMGAEVSLSGSTLTVRGTGQILGIKVDMSKAGELVPTIAAIAALASTSSEITGIAHLRGHETDRIKALVTEINRIGGSAQELEDGIAITPAKLSGGMWHTYADHRMATAGAIIGLRVPGIEIEDIGVTSKTMPEFPNLWLKMLAGN